MLQGYNPATEGPEAATGNNACDAQPASTSDDTESPVKKGYGLGMDKISVLEGVTLYSALDLLPHIFPSTGEKALEACKEMQKKYTAIANIIQPERAAFFVKAVCKDAAVDIDDRAEVADEPPQIRITGWCVEKDTADAALPIDILQDHAMAATNCADIRSAVALLQLAIAAGACKLIAVRDKYRRKKERILSELFGYVFVDVQKLLSGISIPLDPSSLVVSEDGQHYTFPAQFQVLMPRIVNAPKKKARVAEQGGGEECNDDNEEEGGSGEEEDGCGNDESGKMDCNDEEELQTPLLLVSRCVCVCVCVCEHIVPCLI